MRSLLVKRLFAYLVDIALINFVNFLTAVSFISAYSIIHHTTGAELKAFASSPGMIYSLRASVALYYVFYFTLCFWYWGKTVGKKIFGLKVVKSNGSDLSLLTASLRTAGYVLGGQLLFGLGFALAFFRKDAKGLHDLIAGTKVIASDTTQPATEEVGQEIAA